MKAIMGASIDSHTVQLLNEIRALRSRVEELESALEEAEAARDHIEIAVDVRELETLSTTG